MLDDAISRRRVVLVLEAILVFIAAACMYPFLVRDQHIWTGIRRLFEENAAELEELKRAGLAKRGKGGRGDAKPPEPARRRSALLEEHEASYHGEAENRSIGITHDHV